MLHSLQRWAFLAVAFTIPFPIRVNSIVSVIAALLCIIPALRINSLKTLSTSPIFLLVVIQALILAVGLVHSPDLSQGYSDIERFSFSIVLVLLAFSMRDSSVTMVQMVTALAAGCAVVIAYGFIVVLFQLDSAARHTALTLGHADFTDHIGIHPAYLTLYLTLVFFLILEFWKGKTNVNQKSIGLMVGALVVIVALIFFLRSQMGMIVFVLMAAMYLLTHFKRRASMVVFFLTAVALIIYLVDDQRVHTFFDSYGKNVSSALDHRKQIWEGAVSAIADSNLLGSGTGGEQTALNKAFAESGFTEGIDKSYNAHNQYLSFMLRNGVFELLCFASLLFFSFRIALRSEDRSFLIFLMIFALTITIESCLNVQKGIVFFYLFLGAWSYLQKERPSAG